MNEDHRIATRAPLVGRPLRRLFSGADGSTVVQYAIVLALVVCGGVLLFGSAQFAARQFGGVFSAERPITVERSAGVRPGPAPPHGEPTEPAPAVARRVWWAVAVAALLVVAAAIGGWHLVRHRFRRKVQETLNESEGRTRFSPRQKSCLFAKRQQILRVLSRDKTALLYSRIQVRHLMSQDPFTVKPDTPVTEVLEIMKEHKFHHILVCDGRGELLGIISDRDLQDRHGKRAGDIMTRDAETVSPDVPVGRVITLMMNRHISCVPVLDGGRLCGILTTTDMMMTLHSTLQILMKLAAKLGPPQRADAPHHEPSGVP